MHGDVEKLGYRWDAVVVRRLHEAIVLGDEAVVAGETGVVIARGLIEHERRAAFSVAPDDPLALSKQGKRRTVTDIDDPAVALPAPAAGGRFVKAQVGVSDARQMLQAPFVRRRDEERVGHPPEALLELRPGLIVQLQIDLTRLLAQRGLEVPEFPALRFRQRGQRPVEGAARLILASGGVKTEAEIEPGLGPPGIGLHQIACQEQVLVQAPLIVQLQHQAAMRLEVRDVVAQRRLVVSDHFSAMRGAHSIDGRRGAQVFVHPAVHPDAAQVAGAGGDGSAERRHEVAVPHALVLALVDIADVVVDLGQQFRVFNLPLLRPSKRLAQDPPTIQLHMLLNAQVPQCRQNVGVL